MKVDQTFIDFALEQDAESATFQLNLALTSSR
jgi:hypothetical protein